MACRNAEKAEAAMGQIRAEHKKADLVFLPVDLAKQSSIEEFVQRFKEKFDKIDVLVNNAGVDKGPQGRGVWAQTPDGFEWVSGVNHFGTYSLTIRLINAGLFDNSDAPRIVVCTRSVLPINGKSRA